MRSFIVMILLCLLIGGMYAAAASSSTGPLSIEEVMSAAELRSTGISTLNPNQRAALNRWLNAYTLRVLSISQQGTGTSGYLGVGSGHWVQSTGDSGRMVTLEDGSLWEINAIDRLYTMLWLPITEITVLESDSPVGDYRYWLVNTDDGEKALARYLGQ